MASAASNNRVYLFRLQTLIIDGGLLVLRHIFDHKLQLQNISFSVCLSREKGTLTRLRSRNTITQSQYDFLYPATGQSPTTSDLDITLIVCLLRNLKICGLNKKYNWNIAPQAADTCLEADIYRLEKYRNEIAHIVTTTGLNLKNFKSKWTEIEQILLRLNLSNPVLDLQKIIYEMKTSPLDPEEEDRIEETIKQWNKMEKCLEADVKLVKADVQVLKDSVKPKFRMESTSQISKIKENKVRHTYKEDDKYFKNRPDRYDKYLKLLFKGGRFVIVALIEENIQNQNKSLKDILCEKEDFVRKKIDDQDQLKILYPYDQASSSMDISTWDITLLATVLLQVLVDKSVVNEIQEAVNFIVTSQNCYDKTFLESFDCDAFNEHYSFHLDFNVQSLADYLNTENKEKWEKIYKECTTKVKIPGSYQTNLGKSIKDEYEETLKKTPYVLQDMTEHNIAFKNEHVLELKIMIGTGEEKAHSVEDTLLRIWQDGLGICPNKKDFPNVRKELSKICMEIKKMKDVSYFHVTQPSVILGVASSSPCAILDLLNYFESAALDHSLSIISRELGYFFNTEFDIEAVITLESLKDILNDEGVTESYKYHLQPTEQHEKYELLTTGAISNLKANVYKMLGWALERTNTNGGDGEPWWKYIINNGDINVNRKEQRNIGRQSSPGVEFLDILDDRGYTMQDLERLFIQFRMNEALDILHQHQDKGCIDLTSTVDDECVDLTSSQRSHDSGDLQGGNDSSVVIIGSNDWRTCLQTSNKKMALELLDNDDLPDMETLNELCAVFERKSDITFKICKEVCGSIQILSTDITDVYAAREAVVLQQNGEKEDKFEIKFVVVTVELDEQRRKELTDLIHKKCPYDTLPIRDCNQLSWEETELVKAGRHELKGEDLNKIKTCMRLNADILLERHTYLTIISGSPIKSVGFGTSNHRIEETPCIVLNVPYKGYIPIDEDPFEEKYNVSDNVSVLTDVREDIFVLYNGTAKGRHDDLKAGCQISGKREKRNKKEGCSKGTLGGFVVHPDYGLCGISCCHALISPSKLKDLSENNEINWEKPTLLKGINDKALDGFEKNTDFDGSVFQPYDNGEGDINKIGSLVRVLYQSGKNSLETDACGIDVTLFQLSKRLPKSSEFPLVKVSKESDVDSSDCRKVTQQFGKGAVAGFDWYEGNRYSKFGAITGYTTGDLSINCSISVKRLTRWTTKDDQNEFQFILHNQVRIEKSNTDDNDILPVDIPAEIKERFAYEGDSGSLVYRETTDGNLICVGMVSGGSTVKNTGIVTPILPILKELGITGFKNFDSEQLEVNVRTLVQEMGIVKQSIGNVQQSMGNVQQSMETRMYSIETNMVNVQQSMGNVQQSMGNVQQSMETRMDSIETNMVNVQKSMGNVQQSMGNVQQRNETRMDSIETTMSDGFASIIAKLNQMQNP